MVYVLDVFSKQLIEAEIVPISKESVSGLKGNWKFNWKKLVEEEGSSVYVLRTLSDPGRIEGILQLKTAYDMLIMDALELASYNIGKKKRYDYVAGCLIVFSCRESFKVQGPYKGFLTFVSKTHLIEWYVNKYGAQLALGQRMFIDWDKGEELIEMYLNRTKSDKR